MRAVGIATAVALLLALLFLVSTRSGTSRTATAVVPSSRLKAVDGAGQTSTGAAPRVYSYQVVASFPHDASCFTQGLLVRRPLNHTVLELFLHLFGANA